MRGTKRDAERLAASLEVGAGSASPAGRKVSDVLDACIDQNRDTWAPASARDTPAGAPPLSDKQLGYSLPGVVPRRRGHDDVSDY